MHVANTEESYIKRQIQIPHTSNYINRLFTDYLTIKSAQLNVLLFWLSSSICKRSSRNRPRWPKGFRVGEGPVFLLTHGTTRVVGRQPYAPAAFTPGEIPGTHFQRLSRPQVTWFRLREPRKKSPVTPPGIDPGTVRLIAQFLNHYATQGPYLYLNTTVNQKVKWAKPGNFHRKRFFFRISERTLLRL